MFPVCLYLYPVLIVFLCYFVCSFLSVRLFVLLLDCWFGFSVFLFVCICMLICQFVCFCLFDLSICLFIIIICLFIIIIIIIYLFYLFVLCFYLFFVILSWLRRTKSLRKLYLFVCCLFLCGWSGRLSLY